MRSKKGQLFFDFIFLLLSLTFAFYISSTGKAHNLMIGLGDLKLLGIFIAGMFFTSAFTISPAIVLLGQFAETTNLFILAIVGGAGATVGDYLIFRFMRDRVADDLKYLFSFTKPERFSRIFKTKLFHYSIPFLGALVMASPFPNEIGIAILGLSKIRTFYFSIISFIFNGLGILLIGIVAGYI